MGLFDSQAPTPVDLTGSTSTTAPQYLTDYLTQLAKSGQSALGTTSPEGTFTPYTGSELVAGLPQNLKDLYGGAQDVLKRYQTPMDESLAALQSGATGVSAADISKFYDPYQASVINEMGRQSAENVQQGMLPALRGAFAGQGAFGSRRYAGALGQALGNVQSNLLGEQAKLRSEGFKSALDAALKERGYDIQAGQGLAGLGAQEAQAATAGLKTLGDIGTQELSYEQSKLEAPLTRALNVAKILQGYTFPTTVTEKKQALPSIYAPSPLQQLGSLGTLVGSAFGGKDKAGNMFIDWLKQNAGSFGISDSDLASWASGSSSGLSNADIAANNAALGDFKEP